MLKLRSKICSVSSSLQHQSGWLMGCSILNQNQECFFNYNSNDNDNRNSKSFSKPSFNKTSKPSFGFNKSSFDKPKSSFNNSFERQQDERKNKFDNFGRQDERKNNFNFRKQDNFGEQDERMNKFDDFGKHQSFDKPKSFNNRYERKDRFESSERPSFERRNKFGSNFNQQDRSDSFDRQPYERKNKFDKFAKQQPDERKNNFNFRKQQDSFGEQDERMNKSDDFGERQSYSKPSTSFDKPKSFNNNRYERKDRFENSERPSYERRNKFDYNSIKQQESFGEQDDRMHRYERKDRFENSERPSYERRNKFDYGKQSDERQESAGKYQGDRRSKFDSKPFGNREKFKSTVVPFEQFKKNRPIKERDSREKQGFKNHDDNYSARNSRNSNEDFDVDRLIEDEENGYEKKNRFSSSIEKQVDGYIKSNRRQDYDLQSSRQPQKKMPYIPANAKTKHMLESEKKVKVDEGSDFQDLTRVKKIDPKVVEKREKRERRPREIRDPMSDDLEWIDEDEYRAIHQKGLKAISAKKDSISKGTAAILARSRAPQNVKSAMPSNVTFVMDDKETLFRKNDIEEEEEDFADDDEDVIFYGDEDAEEEYDSEDMEFEEEEEEEKPKKRNSKKVKQEQGEISAPKIDILPDSMVERYLKQVSKDNLSKNRQFKSLPVVNSIVKDIFSCGLASKKSLKQAEYLQYFTSDDISKNDEEAKSRKDMSNMLSGNRVIEAQLKRQNVARKTNKTSLIYNQPELRADMQVKDEVVNWVFKNSKMRYVGSIGLTKEDEKLLLQEQENAIENEINAEKQMKEGEQTDLENLSREELNAMLENEENLYEFYRKNYEEDEAEEPKKEEEMKDEEEEKDSFTRKLVDVSQMLEKCKGVPQVAFAGRSNVGKSSLINAITGRNNLKASERPGQTKDLNFHRFGKHFCLVDMPGYGFAFTKDSSVTQKWLELIRKYFVQSSTDLRVVFLLIDSRIGLKRKDMDMVEFLETNNVPYQIVFTKCDLMYVDDLARMAFKTFKVDPITKGLSFNHHIKDENGEFRMIFVSSRSKTGVARLKEDIVLKHSSFDIDAWKKNVKKNVVLFV